MAHRIPRKLSRLKTIIQKYVYINKMSTGNFLPLNLTTIWCVHKYIKNIVRILNDFNYDTSYLRLKNKLT